MLTQDVLSVGELASSPLARGGPMAAGVPVPDDAPSVAADPASKSNDCVNTRWAPSRRPNAVAADAILRSFNTWAFKREQPSDPQLMLQIISESMASQAPLPFVLYWGKGLRLRLDEPDIQCLDYLVALCSRVRAVYAPGAAITLIFTDTHAALNGHSPQSVLEYFGAVDVAARERSFVTCRLSDVQRNTRSAHESEPPDESMSEEMHRRLCASAAKWFRGEGTPEQGAAKYYRMNLLERRAVELAFPRSIFITFNGSELRSIFPAQLPIFFMYSLRRGVSDKPWFLATGSASVKQGKV